MISKSRLYSLIVIVILAALAACDTSIPTPPPITINITAVDDTQALGQAVAEALTATGQANVHLTETVIANNGMTLTPSSTPTITPTDTITPTRPVTATPTPIPTDTFTPTFLPLETNTPAPASNPSYGWIRFVDRWYSDNAQAPSPALDVYINDDRIARGVEFGGQTNYYQVSPGATRVSIRNTNLAIGAANETPAIVTTVIEVPPGGVISVLALNMNGVNLYPIKEDPTPLEVGMSRLTIVHAAPALPTVNLEIADKRLRLASNLALGNIIGPIDVPAGYYSVDANAATNGNSTSTITSFSLQLTGQISNFLVFLPSSKESTGVLTVTDQLTGLTGHVKDDVEVRFVNALTNIGNVQISLSKTVLSDFEVGGLSPGLPVPIIGTTFNVATGENGSTPIGESVLGPFTADEDKTSSRIAVLLPNTQTNGGNIFTPVVFTQNAPRSAINASIRLIHAIPGAVPLNLQIRPIRPVATTDNNGQQGDTTAWATVSQAEYGTASAYSSRNPEVYAIRVVQSGSQTVIAELPAQQFLAGGIYDFVVVPGSQTGSAKLLMVEPAIQVTQLVQGSGNPTAVYEAVSGTLTALAPEQVAVTVTATFTSTPTRTPIPTNTPRPTNTPEFRQPLVNVYPAPPDTTVGTVSLVGENFQPKLQYIITIDGNPIPVTTGQVNDDGTLLESIPLSSNLQPGIHSIQVCADCRVRGAQQSAYAQFIIANPNLTPTATAQP